MGGATAGVELKQQSTMDCPGWATVQVEHQSTVTKMASGRAGERARSSGLGQVKNCAWIQVGAQVEH